MSVARTSWKRGWPTLALHDAGAPVVRWDGSDDGSMTVVSLKGVHIQAQALEQAGGNISHAAAALGITRSALYRRIEKFGL